MTLDADTRERYSRQLVIPAIGDGGQARLAAARVRVVGASGTAAPALLYLTLAGVGTIWIDDPEPVSPADAGLWLFPPATVGEGRASVAAAALQARTRFCRVEPHPPGAEPTAVLVIAPSLAQAVASAEAARRAGLPHVVAEVDGDGGAAVTVPPGAPCFACARSVTASGRPPVAGVAALAALAAGELIFLLADPEHAAGRRVELTRGVPLSRATTRLAGCHCGKPLPEAPG